MPIFPVKRNRIVFDNFGGRGYGDNPMFISEEIHSADNKLELIWFVDNLSNYEFPDYIIPVKIDSVKGIYMRATSKVWVDNVRGVHPIKKRKSQIYLQTWHAPFSPKRLEKDAEDTLSESYVYQAKYDGKICDAIIANSKLQEEQYKRAFWLNEKTEILRYGLPRNDYLVNSAHDAVEYERVRDKFGFSMDDVYILYAPTFRDDLSTKGYELDYTNVLVSFRKMTGKTCHIVVRLHPNVSNQEYLINYNESIINGTNIPNMQELSIACDYVISDYSTSLFDFLVLNKPAFICALDLNEYKKIRGLLPEFDEFPFPKAASNSDFIKLIENFNIDKYKNDVEVYLKKYPIYDKGMASRQVVDWILKKIREC